MTTEQKIMKEIEGLPQQFLDEIADFIKSLKKKLIKKKKLPTFDLGGQCDKMDIRKKAYE
jgi:inorganic pyrophosphatase